MNTSCGYAYNVIYDDVIYNKFCAKCVPKQLSYEYAFGSHQKPCEWVS